MNQKLAIEIQGAVQTVSLTELDELKKNGTSYRIIGKVCTVQCDTTCTHAYHGTCPFSFMRTSDGRKIHVLINHSDQ